MTKSTIDVIADNLMSIHPLLHKSISRPLKTSIFDYSRWNVCTWKFKKKWNSIDVGYR